MEDQKPNKPLQIVALVVAIIALVVSITTHRSLTRFPALETCYSWETHISSGALDHAAWFAGGTMFYYYKDGDEELHWVDVPWCESLEGLDKGDIITVTKEYKEACGCIAGRIVSRSHVAVDVRVTNFSIQHLGF